MRIKYHDDMEVMRAPILFRQKKANKPVLE